MASMLSQFGALTLAPETQFGELPWDFVALFLLCLPVRTRLRAREVSRGWRALLNEPRFWLVLNFSRGSGVVTRVSPRLLFASGERGRGHVHTLDLTGTEGLSAQRLTQFAAAHGDSLRTVKVQESRPLSADQVTRFCRSAPLCTLRCFVRCYPAEALPLLRCEAPCALLHIFKLCVHGFNINAQAVLDLAAALPSHRGKIKELTVYQTTVYQTPLRDGAVVDGLMRGIAEAGVSNLAIVGCYLTPASLPGLTWLLQAGCLERLDIDNLYNALFEEGPDLTAFCDALRSSTLQMLELESCQLWRDPAAAGELLAALVGHQTLRELSLGYNLVTHTPYYNSPPDDTRRAAGEQLASLITHSSALQKFDLTENHFGEVGMAPIFEALPGSSTLKELLVKYEFLSREFARDVILPAVRANTSLRTLHFKMFDMSPTRTVLSELAEAQAIVAARTRRRAVA